MFVLFLFAGRYKSDPRFSFFPIDPTVLFLVAMTILIAVHLPVMKTRAPSAAHAAAMA